MINKSIDATKKGKIINRANLCKPKQEKKKKHIASIRVIAWCYILPPLIKTLSFAFFP